MIRVLLLVGFLFGGEVLGEYQAFIDDTTNLVEIEHSVQKKLLHLEKKLIDLEQPKADATEKLIVLEQSKADATERIAALARQLQGKNSSTYVHLGMKTCPNVTAKTLIYSGQVGGGHHKHSGSGEYVCLPKDPQYDEYSEHAHNSRSLMYGAEYELPESPVLVILYQRDVPCAVCLARGKTTLMVPGRVSCYSGWTKEYQEYLMAEYHGYHGKGYVCMDKHAEPLDAGFANEQGALFYLTEGRCCSLSCPPYINGAELPCVVCSTTI